jgi:MoxR-like ATPase
MNEDLTGPGTPEHGAGLAGARGECDDRELADALSVDYARLRAEIGKRVIAQEQAVELSVLTLLAGGNSLLVGVPGLAKTLLVHTIADALALKFSRIQFTPDLMPSDITGTDLVQEDPQSGRREFHFAPGPVFANVVLADEINRTPPKTQAALLEAMQERCVTVQGKTYPLEQPFFVFATRNPIELEGTYPLPEAQLDRFMFEIALDYLPEQAEFDVVRATTSEGEQEVHSVLSGQRLLDYQGLVRRVPMADSVGRYALALVRASRPDTGESADFVNRWLAYGASVRAAQAMVLAGKARALVHGRVHVTYDDVRALALPVLRHRLLLNFHAEAEGVDSAQIVARLLDHVAVPQAS